MARRHREPVHLRRLSLVFSLVIGFLLAALLDQKIRFENTFRTIFLYPFALSFIVTGLVWQWLLNPEFGVQSVVRSLGWESFNFDPLYDPDIVIYGILHRRAVAADRALSCASCWRACAASTKTSGRPRALTASPLEDLSLHRHSDDAAGVRHDPCHRRGGIVRVYDLVVAQTSGGPGIASEVPAKFVYDTMFFAQNLGQGFAASTMMLLTVIIVIVPWAYLEFGASASMADQGSLPISGPSGPRPKPLLSRAATSFLYGSLVFCAVYYLLPLYVMIVTSLKTMPEIRLGNVFSPPVEITFEPWVKAWSTACTGLNCDGLSRGFWNSVRITVPSVIVSIAIASVNGYALANWRFKGADTFFTVLVVGAFIPYQVMIYPIVIVLRETGRLRHAHRPRHRAHHLRHADPDAALPQLLSPPCRRSCSRRRASMAQASGASSSRS